MGRIHSNRISSADKNLQLNQEEAEGLLTEHIAALELGEISKDLSAISNPVLHFLLKREIIKRRPLDDLKGETLQGLGLAASQWDVLKSDSTAYLYGRAIQEAENMGLDFADPEARMAIIEQSGIQHKIMALRGRMDVLEPGPEQRQLDFECAQALWESDPSLSTGHDYLLTAIKVDSVDSDAILEELCAKGGDYKSFALQIVYSNTDNNDLAGRAQAKYNWKEAKLEAIEDPSLIADNINQYLKVTQECVGLGIEGVSMEKAMELVLEKDPEFETRGHKKAASDAERTLKNLTGNVKNMDPKSAAAMASKLEVLANQLKQQAGIPTSDQETEVK